MVTAKGTPGLSAYAATQLNRAAPKRGAGWAWGAPPSEAWSQPYRSAHFSITPLGRAAGFYTGHPLG